VNRSIAILVALVCTAGAGTAQQPLPTFRAGAATSNITPALGASLNGGMTDRKATHVHDELHARCLVLDDGTTKLAIAVCDSCMIPREVVDEAKRLIEQRTKIPPTHVLISATHTHTAPTATPVFQSNPDPAYVKFLTTRIADGVQRAANNLAPASVGWGVGQCPQHVFNRRWRMRPGTIPPDPFGSKTDQVQTNPPVASESLIEPAGPTDPDVWALAAFGEDGQIALLANYALHYVGGNPGEHVSADYFGMFDVALADRRMPESGVITYPRYLGILANGASGNINNVDFPRRRAPRPPYVQMAVVAGDVATAASASVKHPHRSDVKLDSRTATLRLGVRKPPAEEVRRAAEIVAKAAGGGLRSLPEIYAGETLAMKDYPDAVELVLQVMRIGDTVICAIPCEVFVEMGLELKAKSPFKPTVVFSLANGYNGYLPTPEHHRLGGYETWRAKSSYLEVDAAPRIVAKLLELLEEVK
jgi:neutral ceramidase